MMQVVVLKQLAFDSLIFDLAFDAVEPP